MPRNNLTELSATDAENTDVKGVSIAEGMAPSGVNNAIRAVAAMLARRVRSSGTRDQTHRRESRERNSGRHHGPADHRYD